MQTLISRARACLYGAAIGDSLGMPTQDLSRETIYKTYGRITDFCPAHPVQEIAKDLPAGTVTDDTEQLLIVAKLLRADGRIDAYKFAAALQSWQDEMIARGSQDLLGPSSSQALANLRAGMALGEVGRNGTTNGAAMRIAPVGIAYGEEKMLVQGIIAASILTHNTAEALSGAALVAASVSAGLQGANGKEAVAYAKALTQKVLARYYRESGIPAGVDADAEGTGVEDKEPAEAKQISSENPVLCALERAETLMRGSKDLELTLAEEIGTSLACTQSVVGAIALAEIVDDPWEGLLIAARAGGDTDTIGAISGAILGATQGMSAWPVKAVETVTRVNQLDLDQTAAELLNLRNAPR